MRVSVTVVVASHDRRDSVLHTLDRLTALPERPPVVVVDNASSDGTADAVIAAHPGVEVVRLPRNRGAAGRTAGVVRARTPLVAFADDDSWWQPGALPRAAECFAAAPRLAVLAARVLVGADLREDPMCAALAAAPLPAEPDLPGPAVRGFLACGAVVRRSAYLAVGGFSDLLFFLGEEQDLALRLVTAGWGCAYAADVVAEHHPQRVTRDSAGRRRLHLRNDVLAAWLLRRPRVAAAATARLAGVAARGDRAAAGALGDVARRIPDVAARRTPVPWWLEDQLAALAGARP